MAISTRADDDHRQKALEYYHANREAGIQSRRSYKERNREKIRERNRTHARMVDDRLKPIREIIASRMAESGVICQSTCNCVAREQLLCELPDQEAGILGPGDPGYRHRKVADYGEALNEILGVSRDDIKEYDPFDGEEEFRPTTAQIERAAKSANVNLVAEVKRCTECLEWQPFSAFARDNGGLLGLRSKCRSCTTKYRKNWESKRGRI